MSDLEIRRRCFEDFRYYAALALRIRSKSGQIVPLLLNRAQLYIHGRLEKQRAETGKVRGFILKGRQQGCSTYVEGRYFWRVTHTFGVRAYILTHLEDATANIFNIATRYYDHCPALLRPRAGTSNSKELLFDLLDSGYKVATARSKGAGRSSTIQFFHGSEVAFWPNASEHMSGAMQAVPDAPGTEVLLESTAWGMGNEFHKGWQDAESGASEYEAIFVPWFWQEEYRSPVPDGFVLEREDQEYMDAYGLDIEQMAWRAKKIIELKDPLLFKQEYPATPAEAFQVTGHDSYIKPDAVLRARKGKLLPAVDGVGAVLCGVDPARFGDDTTDIICRQGRIAFDLQRFSKKDTMEVAGICRKLLEDHKPRIDCMFVDVGGLGAGVYDRLREMGLAEIVPGFGPRVRAVNFGGTPDDQERYRNKRAEMWGEMRDWLTGNLPVQIPDDDILHADLVGPAYKYDSMTRLVLESKEEMKKRGVRSPNSGDALALTFAEPVVLLTEFEKAHIEQAERRRQSGWEYDPLTWEPGQRRY